MVTQAVLSDMLSRAAHPLPIEGPVTGTTSADASDRWQNSVLYTDETSASGGRLWSAPTELSASCSVTPADSLKSRRKP